MVEKVGSSRHVEWLNPSSNLEIHVLPPLFEDSVVQAEVASNPG